MIQELPHKVSSQDIARSNTCFTSQAADFNLSYWDALTAVDVGPFSACDLGHDVMGLCAKTLWTSLDPGHPTFWTSPLPKILPRDGMATANSNGQLPAVDRSYCIS